MFPKENLYVYKSSKLDVLCPHKKIPFDKQLIINEYNIYLGKFIKTKTAEWTNGRKITNGLAFFEYGCIYFPNYRNIGIMNMKLFQNFINRESMNLSSKVSFDDSIIYFNDIYDVDDVIEDLIED